MTVITDINMEVNIEEKKILYDAFFFLLNLNDNVNAALTTVNDFICQYCSLVF